MHTITMILQTRLLPLLPSPQIGTLVDTEGLLCTKPEVYLVPMGTSKGTDSGVYCPDVQQGNL